MEDKRVVGATAVATLAVYTPEAENFAFEPEDRAIESRAETETRAASPEKNLVVFETSLETDAKANSPEKNLVVFDTSNSALPDLEPSWETVQRNLTSQGLVDLDVVCPCTKESPCLLDKLILEERMNRKKRAIDRVVRQSMTYHKQQRIIDFVIETM